jgi:hypothetical protein
MWLNAHPCLHILLLMLLMLQERTNPQLLMSSPSRRRRVAEGSGRSEQDVAELMAAFAQMKAQTSQMSKIMKLGQGGLARLLLGLMVLMGETAVRCMTQHASYCGCRWGMAGSSLLVCMRSTWLSFVELVKHCCAVGLVQPASALPSLSRHAVITLHTPWRHLLMC